MYLGALERNYPVEAAGRVVEYGNADRRRGGRQPRPLCLGIDMKHMGLASKDRLLPEKKCEDIQN